MILKWHIYLQLSTLPLPQLWSALFFFMLYTLGLDSSMCMIESVSTFVVDSAPATLRSKKTLVTLAICIVFFLASIVFACDAATHLVDIIGDHFGPEGLPDPGPEVGEGGSGGPGQETQPVHLRRRRSGNRVQQLQQQLQRFDSLLICYYYFYNCSAYKTFKYLCREDC